MWMSGGEGIIYKVIIEQLFTSPLYLKNFVL